MAIATRPKPKVHNRKRQAQHHSHSKLYLKAYWPYLPMLAIVGIGTYMNKSLYTNSASSVGAVTGTSVATSRIQTITGQQSSWIYLVTLTISALAFAYFVFAHYRRFHKLVNKSERYLIKHPLVEICVVLVCTLTFVLTRSASLRG